MRKLLSLLVLSCFALCASAAPASTESVENLLALMKAEKLVEGMLRNIDQSMRQSMEIALKGQALSAEQQRMVDVLPAKIGQIMREELDWNRMRSVYVQIYQESFTQEEIDGLLAFYKSPAGMAYIEKMPVVMQKSMALSQTRLAPMVEKLKAAMEKALADVKAAK